MKKPIETEIIIKQRLKKIEEAVEVLKDINKIPKSNFLEDQKSQFAAMYALVLGIEAICDIGSHILARYFNRAPETYQDIIIELGEVDVIPKNFAQKSKKMTDFRNLLIHVYLKIDPEIVYNNLQKAPQEFTKFSKYFLKFLES